jgi:hypothetical protein
MRLYAVTQSIDAQPGCLFGSVGVNLNTVASGVRSFEQMRKSRAIPAHGSSAENSVGKARQFRRRSASATGSG